MDPEPIMLGLGLNHMGHRKISLLGRQETYIEIEKQDRGRNA